jgi:hypothetical protein
MASGTGNMIRGGLITATGAIPGTIMLGGLGYAYNAADKFAPLHKFN